MRTTDELLNGFCGFFSMVSRFISGVKKPSNPRSSALAGRE